jgi:hypothetical protein
MKGKIMLRFLRLSTILFLVIVLSTSVWADTGAITKGLFFGEEDPLIKYWEQSFQKATSGAIVQPGEGLDVTALYKEPRRQTELKEVSLDEIKRLRLLGHANIPLKVLMVCSETTRDEVQGMFEIIKLINEESNLPAEEQVKLVIVPSSDDALKGLQISLEDFNKYAEINYYFQTRDIWMQDWGEIAAVEIEGADKERMVVLDTRRGRDLAELPAILARLWNGNYCKPDIEDGPCGNYGGNIEVTPDDTLVIGDTSTQRLRDFFATAGYKDKMAVLETSWLTVGHVDEYVSTVCTPESDLGYTIVKADPLMAMNQLASLPDGEVLNRLDEMVQNFYAYYSVNPGGYVDENLNVKKVFRLMGHVYDYLNGAQNEWTNHSADFVEFNQKCAEIIDRNIETLKATLRRRHGDIDINVVSFPTLFEKMRGDKACAILPGVVNMVSLRDHLIIPHPLLREYKNHIQKVVTDLGYKPHFVPNGSYHFLQGQLHCGSNTFRHPNRYVHPRYERARQSGLFQERH